MNYPRTKPSRPNCPKVCGVGDNGGDSVIRYIDGKVVKSFSHWKAMLSRCYGSLLKKSPTYEECTVCEEWLHYPTFMHWWDVNYIEGYQLDKDILVQGNKVYSPETCCYIPQYINNLILERGNVRGQYPLGVTKQGSRYKAACRIGYLGVRSKHIGMYSTPEQAHQAYVEFKTFLIKSVALSEFKKDLIDVKVFSALIEWQVS